MNLLKNSILTFILLLHFNSVSSQSFITSYQSPIYSNRLFVQSIDNIFNDGYILSGVHYDSTLRKHIPTLIRTDNLGSVLWSSEFSFIDSISTQTDVKHISTGGFIVCYTNWTYNYVIVIKLNDTGSILWKKKFYWGGLHISMPTVIECDDGGFVISSTRSLLFKLNQSGNLVWSRGYFNYYYYTISPTQNTIQTYDKSYVNASSGAMISKTDSNGNPVWVKIFGDSIHSHFHDVYEDSNKDIYALGYTNSYTFANSFEILLVKIDSDGNIIWSKTYGATDQDIGFSISKCKDGNIFISGITFSFPLPISNVFVMKIDINGDVIWSKKINDYSFLKVNTCSTSDYGIALAFNSSTDFKGVNGYLAKGNSQGNFGCNTDSFPVSVNNTIISSRDYIQSYSGTTSSNIDLSSENIIINSLLLCGDTSKTCIITKDSTLSACDSLTYKSKVYYESTTIGEIYNSSTCDSILQLNINIQHPLISNIDTLLRSHDSIIMNNFIIKKAGLYIDTFSSFYNCDSIVFLNVSIVPSKTIIPNIITPNRDGINDFFTFKHSSSEKWNLIIYSRWGKKVYQKNNYNYDWNGEGLVDGVYYYRIISYINNKEYKDWVQILR